MACDIVLSIVTGTYNRHVHLGAMIDSARRNIPRHIPHEFVIVDGGSTDSTIEWCQRESDIRLILQGELRGAIPAFCEGARAARGDYILLANDDVTFCEYSIMRALAYLESHPVCGAVAFADTRAAQMGQGQGYQVLGMPAIGTDGKSAWVPYAQVGLFRRWLGDLAGWWGADDSIMNQSRTYGGDNYLSSRIWEMGYSVDAVEGCNCDDGIVRDGLRDISARTARTDSKAYYTRFPRGAQLRANPTHPNPQTERLRILVVPIYEPNFPGRRNLEYGLSEALTRYGLTYEWDFVNEPGDLIAHVQAWQPHLLIVQLHDALRITVGELSRARAACPTMAVVNWNGDAHEAGLISPEIIELLHYVDLQTVVNAAVLPTYAAVGIRAVYWQIGYKDPAHPFSGNVPIWDVLFLGNCYNNERRELASTLKSLPRLKIGIYGNCPLSDGNTHYDFAFSRALYEKCKVAISDTFPGGVGYVSNRLFQALAAGAFVLQQHVPEMEQWNGLIPGVHYIEWHTLDELFKLCKEWTKTKRYDQRRKIADAGRDFVRANFSYDRQVEKLWDLLPST